MAGLPAVHFVFFVLTDEHNTALCLHEYFYDCVKALPHAQAPPSFPLLAVCKAGQGLVSEPDPRKIEKEGGSGKLAGVEVYTAHGMQAHFRLAFD